MRPVIMRCAAEPFFGTPLLIAEGEALLALLALCQWLEGAEFKARRDEMMADK